MNEKVKLTKEQAEALEHLTKKQELLATEIIRKHVESETMQVWHGITDSLNFVILEDIIRALYIGYEVEQTVEEQLQELFNVPKEYGAVKNETIIEVLNIIGMKVKGINA